MRLSSSLFLAANSSSEMMPRWRRSSSWMSRSRISKRAVPGGGGGGRRGGRRRAGTASGWGAPAHAEGRRVVRVAVAMVVASTVVTPVLVGVLVGVGRAVPVPRLHLRRDRLAPAAADDLVDLGVEDALHDGRLAHVLQGERIVLALHVDEQRARPEHPLDQGLTDVDLGDALQPQLHGVAPEDALAHQDPRGGQRDDVGAPTDEPAEQPQARDQAEDEDRIVRPAPAGCATGRPAR